MPSSQTFPFLSWRFSSLTLRGTCVLTLLGIVVAVAPGCCPSRECRPLEARTDVGAGDHEIEQCLDSVYEQHGAGGVEVLVLSGGGRNGAWGAGVLKGWREHPNASRPETFHIVTGISTGALLATPAFLGRHSDDELMHEAYTTTDNKKVLRKRNALTALLFSNALNSTEPLARTLKELLPDPLIDDVAREDGKGRGLFIGTVDLDTGMLVIWDMIAVARERAYDRYRAILLAAAAIPVVFPPVMIDEEMHVDGGAREQLFIRRILLPLCQEYADRAADAESGPPPPRIHVLVNGTLGPEEACVSNCTKEIALRTITLLLDANIYGNLHQVRSLTLRYGLGFELSFIPPEHAPEGSSENFDLDIMKKLYKDGFRWARAESWLTDVPEVPFVGPRS